MTFKPNKKQERSPLLSPSQPPKPARLENISFWLNLFSGIVLLGICITFCSKFLTEKAIVETDCLGLGPYVAADSANWLFKMLVNVQKLFQRNASEPDEENGKDPIKAPSCCRRSLRFFSDTFFDSNILPPVGVSIYSMAHKKLQPAANGYGFTVGFTIEWAGLVKNLWQSQNSDTPMPRKLINVITNPAQLLQLCLTTSVGLSFLEESPLQGNLNVIRFASTCFFLLLLVTYDVHKKVPRAIRDGLKRCCSGSSDDSTNDRGNIQNKP